MVIWGSDLAIGAPAVLLNLVNNWTPMRVFECQRQELHDLGAEYMSENKHHAKSLYLAFNDMASFLSLRGKDKFYAAKDTLCPLPLWRSLFFLSRFHDVPQKLMKHFLQEQSLFVAFDPLDPTSTEFYLKLAHHGSMNLYGNDCTLRSVSALLHVTPPGEFGLPVGEGLEHVQRDQDLGQRFGVRRKIGKGMSWGFLGCRVNLARFYHACSSGILHAVLEPQSARIHTHTHTHTPHTNWKFTLNCSSGHLCPHFQNSISLATTEEQRSRSVPAPAKLWCNKIGTLANTPRLGNVPPEWGTLNKMQI